MSDADDDTVVIFPGDTCLEADEFDPDSFLPVVHASMRDRPLTRVVVLALDCLGHFTIHSSIADIELTRSMVSMAERDTYEYLVHQLAAADFEFDEDPDNSA